MEDSKTQQNDGAEPAPLEGESLISGDVLVGGQAVIEGVMMRTPNAVGVAVRMPDGSISHRSQRIPRLSERYPLFKWPVFRGVGILGQSLVLGVQALNYSAAVATESDAGAEKGSEKGLSAWVLAGTLGISALLGAGLFILLPLYLAGILRNWIPIFQNWMAFNIADGVIRLLIFLGYIALMLLSPDIRRVFEYHGAEHKVVYNWEAKQALSVGSAKGFSRLHPRCGTSFLLIVMAVSILVFSITKFSSFLILAASRLVLMPLIAGLSYELIRWSAKKMQSRLIFAAFKPGLMLQRLTTREPSDSQLEVAVEALKCALKIEKDLAIEGAKEAAA